MNAIEFIRMSLQAGEPRVLALATDMKDAPLTAPTPRGGNHPLWVMGHLAFAESRLLSYIEGGPPALAHWQDLFAPGTEPSSDAARYPSMDEVISTFKSVRERTLKLLDTLTDADLDRESHAPPERREFAGTIGKCLMLICSHPLTHIGQLADARRTAGRPPLFTMKPASK
jgi:hypothetical protein